MYLFLLAATLVLFSICDASGSWNCNRVPTSKEETGFDEVDIADILDDATNNTFNNLVSMINSPEYFELMRVNEEFLNGFSQPMLAPTIQVPPEERTLFEVKFFRATIPMPCNIVTCNIIKTG
ncbi:hypothetical protein M426DRAFT_22822 [Hypoxylon sp. CI-4A]|nr:hypothetical protein M426DRAFT_22822 [Hypoxylon sp. CI-4A]